MDPRFEDSGEVREDARPDDFVQSVGRAMRVLEIVGRHPGLPVKAIARQCDAEHLHELPPGPHPGLRGLPRPAPQWHLRHRRHRRPPLPRPRHIARPARPRRPSCCASSPNGSVVSSYLGLLKDERVTVVEVAEAVRVAVPRGLRGRSRRVRPRDRAGQGAAGRDDPARAAPVPAVHELRPFTSRTRTEPDQLEAELGAVTSAGRRSPSTASSAKAFRALPPWSPGWATATRRGPSSWRSGTKRSPHGSRTSCAWPRPTSSVARSAPEPPRGVDCQEPSWSMNSAAGIGWENIG